MDRNVQLEDVVDASVGSLKASLYVTMPGAVVSYDSASRTASIQPMCNDPRMDVTTGAIVNEPWPVLHGVPVAWLRFGGFMIVGNLNPGDAVTLQAYDLDPTNVFAQGRSQSPVNVGYVRRLSGNFWRAIPDDVVTPVEFGPAAGVTIIGMDGNAAQIQIAQGSIKLGSSATNFVALSNLVATELGKIATAITGLGGAYTPGPVAAALVKAE